MADLHAAAQAYRAKFGDTPTYAMMPDDLYEKATELLQQAVADDKPFADESDWYAALGLKPPPDDALT
jgi:hypothetical protein